MIPIYTIPEAQKTILNRDEALDMPIPASLQARITTMFGEPLTPEQVFHQKQPLPNWTTHELGGTLGQRVTPIQRVGVYVPGGTAPLPSSLLMSVIPAQVAGVSEIIIATPPGKNGATFPMSFSPPPTSSAWTKSSPSAGHRRLAHWLWHREFAPCG
jgi:hypothetical protein